MSSASICLLAGAKLLLFPSQWFGRRPDLVPVGFAAGAFVFGSLAFYKYTVDDAYISLRYARNLAEGHGLVFSTDGSVRIEGYTNFLWVVLESLVFLVGVSDAAAPHVMKGIGIGFGVGVVVLSFLLARRVAGPGEGSAAALAVAAVPYFQFWTIGGLETPLFTFLVVAALHQWVREEDFARSHLFSGLLIGLAALTRPEGALIAASFLGCGAVLVALQFRQPRSALQRLLPAVAVFAAILGSFLMWRYAFYGDLLPNTYHAKVAGPNGETVLARVENMGSLLAYVIPIMPLAVMGIPARRPPEGRAKFLIWVVFLTLVAGSLTPTVEWMPGFRYEVPWIALVMILGAVGVARIASDPNRVREKALVQRIGGALLMVVLLVLLLVPAASLQPELRYADRLERAHVALGGWLFRHAPPNSSYASWDMGAVPYFSHIPRVIDIHPEGLLDADTPRYGYDLDRFLNVQPTFIVLKAPDPNQTEGYHGMHEKPAFRENYHELFVFMYTTDYALHVYLRNDVRIPVEALEEGHEIARRSQQAAENDGLA